MAEKPTSNTLSSGSGRWNSRGRNNNGRLLGLIPTMLSLISVGITVGMYVTRVQSHEEAIRELKVWREEIIVRHAMEDGERELEQDTLGETLRAILKEMKEGG